MIRYNLICITKKNDKFSKFTGNLLKKPPDCFFNVLERITRRVALALQTYRRLLINI